MIHEISGMSCAPARDIPDRRVLDWLAWRDGGGTGSRDGRQDRSARGGNVVASGLLGAGRGMWRWKGWTVAAPAGQRRWLRGRGGTWRCRARGAQRGRARDGRGPASNAAHRKPGARHATWSCTGWAEHGKQRDAPEAKRAARNAVVHGMAGARQATRRTGSPARGARHGRARDGRGTVGNVVHGMARARQATRCTGCQARGTQRGRARDGRGAAGNAVVHGMGGAGGEDLGSLVLLERGRRSKIFCGCGRWCGDFRTCRVGGWLGGRRGPLSRRLGGRLPGP